MKLEKCQIKCVNSLILQKQIDLYKKGKKGRYYQRIQRKKIKEKKKPT